MPRLVNVVLILILLSLVQVRIIEAGSPLDKWNKTYGGKDLDYANSIIQANDTGYAIVGGTYSFGAGVVDFWLIKIDSSGNMEWNSTYGGTGVDSAESIIQTRGGGYVMAGSTSSFGAGDRDIWVVKTSSDGDMLWNKTLGGTDYDLAKSVVQTADGGYAVAGYTFSFGAGRDDFWLIKIGIDGNVQWNRTYGGPDSDQAYCVVQTADGGYVLVGETLSTGLEYRDLWVIKTDGLGSMVWNKTYGGIDSDWADSVIQTSDGGCALAGHTYPSHGGVGYFWLVKVDSAGDMEWNTTYVKINEECVCSVVQTPDGGYAIASSTSSLVTSDSDFWLAKINFVGNLEWSRTYGGPKDDWGSSMITTVDGGYAIVGTTSSFGAGDHDIWLVKTDNNGIVPEFPSIFPLFLFVITAMSAIIIQKRHRAQSARYSTYKLISPHEK